MKDFFRALDDVSLLQCLIFGEAEGEDIKGKIAVGCVVRNRVNNPSWWGDGWKSVMLKPWQFSCFDELADKITAAYKEEPASMKECLWVAGGIINDSLLDITKSANHYHAEYLIPYWSKGETPVAIIGKHIFYKL